MPPKGKKITELQRTQLSIRHINQINDEYLIERISSAAFNRIKQLRDIKGAAARAEVTVGDTITIGGIKPKYLKGAEVEVTDTSGDSCFVKIPEFGYRKYSGRDIGIPWACVNVA